MKQAGPRAALCAVLLASTWLAEGCAVASATAGAAISVTGAVVSTGVSLTGKAIGAGIDAMSSKPDEADGSGIVIRERMAPAPEAAPRCTPSRAMPPLPRGWCTAADHGSLHFI
ncbi:hypothetical protein H0I39_00850 [Ottowia beijingensis]|uniref:Lipoprotein n=1 Tax=Ottowia beijingensis TaxID=1207057 RepID=A0A853IUZ3_9BURK|nr:hypothetical protein [Ottowia beijingensis]NZA00690.1 hypothetical protein [Ottowia beijingensis]